ncbi:MAG: alpha/beta fold hydrolase [Betaproteobacteria bacterium]
MIRFPSAFALAACLLTSVAVHAHDDPTCTAGVVARDAMIPSDTPGISLYVRNKHSACPRPDQAKRVLLFVHGATYPAETAFDLQLDGQSWMDYIARQGWDVWLVDLRGYGRSTRPPEMEQPAADNAPIVTTDVAIRDVGAAADHVRGATGAERITLIGWSWGTTIMGGYAAAHPDQVERLVLYAPVWLRTTPSQLAGGETLPAYRVVAKEAAKQRWLRGVPADKSAALIPAGWFEAWSDATWATDPQAAATGMLRAPNGVIKDIREYWMSGKPSYDPAKITAPTLLVLAEWDQDTPPYMAQGLFAQLTAAPWKRLVTIGEGTHTVIMEKNRMQLFHEVQLFLDEAPAGP